MNNKRNLEFLYEVGSLVNMPRGWVHQLGVACASVSEHTFRVVWISLMIARREGQPIDENKMIKMALVHDLGETRTSDLGYVAKGYTKPDEETAVKDLFAETLVDDFKNIWEEYEKRDCLEAKVVRDADNLDLDLEQQELKERGHQLPDKWLNHTRKMVRDEKLYTQTAKEMFDEIWQSDPSSWHMSSQKYLKDPNAGK